MAEKVTKQADEGTDVGNTKFVHYFGPVLDALRALGPSRPREVFEWIKNNSEFPREDLEAVLATGNRSRFEKNIEFAKFYLAHIGLADSPKYGIWGLTEEGKKTNLDYNQAYRLFREQADKFRANRLLGREYNPEDIIADNPENIIYRADVPSLPDDPVYWFGGAAWGRSNDQTERFLLEGIWQVGWTGEHKFSDKIREMRPGEKIAIKSAFTRKHNLPFNNRGKTVSVMSIKATGTILENPGDGRTVKVAWDPPVEPREWYMYTYQTTLAGAEPKNEMSRKLISFAFRGERQDLDFWLAQKYWADKYGEPSPGLEEPFDDEEDGKIGEAGEDETVQSYTAASIVEEGCFLALEKIESILSRLESRKNIILQGPPGTGKTWLAKRLAYALIGHASSRAEERMRVVQFHPSLSYEDFVRGWRPSADGRLTLSDGLFLDAINAAKSDPRPFVVVIEEINRGNPASIFGELLTLLEGDKRRASEGITLAYTHPDRRAEKVYLPDNLYIIGTMNIADRSLALVDLALRRRFSFYTLEPEYNGAWMDWCMNQGKLEKGFVSKIGDRIEALNREIASGLGEQFRIGHSYFTPVRGQTIADGESWFRNIVETEVQPLLEEYFFEDTARVKKLSQQLLAGL